MEEEFEKLAKNILNIIFSPPLDYTSVKNVIHNYIGPHITLSQKQFDYLKNKCSYFKNTANYMRIKLHFYNKQKDKEMYAMASMTLFENLLITATSKVLEIQTFVGELDFTLSYSPINLNNKETKGTDWVRTLFRIYLKYGGNRGVSCIDFFKSIKDNWEKLEDSETIEISYITETILGGYSLEHISQNLQNWLKLNYDVVGLKYRNIIKIMA
jgi:hypothetical protein